MNIYTYISTPYGYINSIYTTSPGGLNLGSGISGGQAIIQQESGILEARVVCSEISEAAGDGTLWCWELNIISIWIVWINGDIVAIFWINWMEFWGMELWSRQWCCMTQVVLRKQIHRCYDNDNDFVATTHNLPEWPLTGYWKGDPISYKHMQLPRMSLATTCFTWPARDSELRKCRVIMTLSPAAQVSGQESTPGL